MGPAAGAAPGRLPGVDGLRAVAALSIVVYHCWRYGTSSGRPADLGPLDEAFVHLPVGVTLFFALSGFLLYRPFAAALMRGTALPSIRGYFRNRSLRILPAYWVALVATSALLGTTLVRTSPVTVATGSLDADGLWRSALFVQNYGPSSMLTGIGPAWSLVVELVFYLALPLVVLATARWRSRGGAARRRLGLVPPLLLWLIGVSGKLVATFVVPGLGPGAGWFADWHSVIERSFWANADLFAAGMVVAVLSVQVEDGRAALHLRWRSEALLLAAAVGVGTAVLFDAGAVNRYHYDMLMAAACGLLLAAVVVPGARRARWLDAVLGARPLVFVGVVSYSLFLWHEPLVRWFSEHGLTFSGSTGLAVNLAMLVSASLAVAALSYYAVEAPALRRKVRRRAPDETAPVPPAPMAVAP